MPAPNVIVPVPVELELFPITIDSEPIAFAPLPICTPLYPRLAFAPALAPIATI